MHARDVHDLIAHGEELHGLQRLGEEVRQVVERIHVGYADLHVLDTLADEEVSPSDVLSALVVLGVVGEIAGAGVVGAELQRSVEGEVELLQEVGKVDAFLSRLGGGHDLGFAGRQGDRVLLLRGP